MNVSAVKVAAVRAAKVTVLKGKINLPHILVGIGVVGLVGTAVLAAKATRSVDDILIDALGHKANLDDSHESGELVKEFLLNAVGNVTIGMVMGYFKERYAGQYDGGVLSRVIVKEFLLNAVGNVTIGMVMGYFKER